MAIVLYNSHINHNKGATKMSIYTVNGYENRKDYLNCLAEDYGVDIETVYIIASTLGSSEDFDGLVSHIEDIAEF